MPQVTVYIRQDDLEAWKSIEKKSEFMHTVLNYFSGSVGPSQSRTIPNIPGVTTADKIAEPTYEDLL